MKQVKPAKREKETDRQIDRQTDRQTDRQRSRQTDKQTDREGRRRKGTSVSRIVFISRMKNSRSNAHPLLTAVAHREGGSVFAGQDLKRTHVQEPVVTVSTGKRTPSTCAKTL